MPAEKKDIFYEGDWSDYYIDIDGLDLNKKVKRMAQLEEIEEEITIRKRQVLSWISLPVLLVVFVFFQLLINSIPNIVIRWMVMFLYATLTITILSPVAIKPKNKVKFRWRRWILTIILWLAFLSGLKLPTSTSAYGVMSIITLVIVFFALSLVFMFIYLGLSNAGHEEMKLIATKEKEYLYREIASKITTGRLEPISLEYDIILESDEIPLLEMDGVLVEVIDTDKYYNTEYQNTQSSKVNMADWFSKTGFGVNTQRIKKDLNQIINTATSGTINILRRESQRINDNKRKTYRIPDPNFDGFGDSIGKIILTNDRILFVGSSQGFQIDYLELVSCTLNRSQKEIISFETTKTVRILATDFSNWIKLYVDRLAQDARI